MKIDRVQVTYGELRSTGYPEYSNKRYELTLSATIESGESAEHVRQKLTFLTQSLVKKEFGDKDQMDIPF